MVSASTYNLSRYRENGTDCQFGHAIDRLIDTAHFTHSHHSRMLQLADVYMYAQQMAYRQLLPQAGRAPNSPPSFGRKRGWLAPHRYKDWPTAQSWYA